MTDKLLPCPFCADPMEDRGYGAIHINGKGCGIDEMNETARAVDRLVRELADAALASEGKV